MNDDNIHINLWAEKLQQVWIPPAEESWTSMQRILNKEMPIAPAKDWRRWLLLIIFILLVLGVCNCPGVLRTRNHAAKNNTSNIYSDKHTTDKKISDNKKSIATETQSRSTNNTSKDETVSKITLGENDKKSLANHNITHAATNDLSHLNKNKNRSSDENKTNEIVSIKHVSSVSHQQINQLNNIPQYAKKTSKKNNRQKKFSIPEKINSPNDQKRENDITKKEETVGTDTTSQSSVKQQSKKPDTAVLTKAPIAQKKKDSTQLSKKDKIDSASKKEIEKGWAVGIGINQFFAIGGQQKSNFNSSGTNGTITDYIPVPMVRYYFSRKLYAQLELQFNVPQYTKQLLADQKLDVAAGINHSVFIKKLYYFNVPLSIHYSLVKNFFIGAGLQYSKLSNGIASYQEKPIIGIDSLHKATVKSFKGDSLYSILSTHEWRFLLDANYQWKKLVLGVRYNQALSNFINVQVSTTQITQARNSSVQAYLRYIFLQRKKIKKLPAK